MCRFTETIERERARVTSDLQRREDDMRATFIKRVKDKENELQAAEQALTNKYNKLKVTLATTTAAAAAELGDYRTRTKIQFFPICIYIKLKYATRRLAYSLMGRLHALNTYRLNWCSKFCC